MFLIKCLKLLYCYVLYAVIYVEYIVIMKILYYECNWNNYMDENKDTYKVIRKDEVVRKTENCETLPEYSSLTPFNGMENNEMFKSLDFAFSQNEIHNIAISGAYGSGKSSLWLSYKEYVRKRKIDRESGSHGSGKSSLWLSCIEYLKKRIFNRKLKKNLENALQISLAKLCDDSPQEGSSSGEDQEEKKDERFSATNVNTLIHESEKDYDDEKELQEREIERNILQQILYSAKQSEIEDSSFETAIKTEPIWHIVLICCLSVLVNVFLLKVVEPNIVHDIVENKDLLWPALCLMLNVVFTCCLIGLIKKLRKVRFGSIKVHEIEVSLEKKDGFVFNRYLSDIVYFFKKTKKKIVVFEDLDRFKNTLIFVKLRELNNLLNGSPELDKKCPIRFVFMVKDDLFTRYRHTKFFDYIVPVVPVFNAINAAGYMHENLKNIDFGDNDEFFSEIEPYMKDLRVLKNCINEFRVYKVESRIKNSLNKKLFTFLLYKNLCSKDYTNFLKRKGILYRCLEEIKEEGK